MDPLATAYEIGGKTAWLNRSAAELPPDSPSADYEWRSQWDLVDCTALTHEY